LGDSNVERVRFNGILTSLSDVRDKKDILTLNNGLDFISKLKPVSFNWNMRDGGKVDIPAHGFIAQDLQQVQIESGINVPGLVYESNPDKLEASYSTLLPLMVKAIQELKEEIKLLKKNQNQNQNQNQN